MTGTFVSCGSSGFTRPRRRVRRPARVSACSRSPRSRRARRSPASAAVSSTGAELDAARRGRPYPLAADRRRPLHRERAAVRSDADYVNHSCDPNCGIVGSVLLVTMRDVEAGEELCFDYAMTDSDDYDEFDVLVRHRDRCRGVVTGADWKEPELRDRYAGWYSTYLERRLRSRRAAGCSRSVNRSRRPRCSRRRDRRDRAGGARSEIRRGVRPPRSRSRPSAPPRPWPGDPRRARTPSTRGDGDAR